MTREEVIAIAKEHQQWDPRDDENKRNIDTTLMRETYASYFGMPSAKGFFLAELFLAFCEDREPLSFNLMDKEEDERVVSKLRHYQELLTDNELT